jgi:signal transduction histidine kinase
MFRFANGHMVAVPLPGEMVTGFDIQAFTEDHAGNLWVSVVRNGVFRWRDGVWTPYGNLPDLPRDTVLALMTDSRGRVWFSYPGSTGIAVVDGSTVQRFSSQEVQVIDAFGLYERAGHIWIGGERGLALFDGSQFRALAADGRTFSGITGIVETADGDLWLSGAPGIIHVPAEQARRAVENRDYHARCEILDVLDGLRGTAVQLRPVPTAVETSDGRLWFTTTKTLSQIDPAHLLRNGTPPPVYIRAIDSVGKEYAPSSNVKLPLGTRSVNITYTALSYWVPQRVRFRYQLEGVDKVWQDAGARREASYSNLGPGSYHFRVIACNNDGVWNDAGASLDFSIAPAFYQATWFSVSCFILIIVAVAASYRLRVRQITEAMNSRFDDRLAERTRIARDFHDTLLQTIQGSKMVADDALNKPADPIQMRRAMESVSRWLMQAMQEGRSALQSLRSSTTERDDLAGALRRAGDECRFQGSIEFDLYVDGACREMHPIVRDEVYRIGYEAVRNACIHSGGSRVEVKLGYVENLVLRVRDNGKGMDPQATEPGKSDRFGLTGMRERASRIGGRFSLLSSPGAGTTVELVVPRKIAFQRAKRIGRFEAFLRRI